jgi:hypothetical protein
MSDNMIPFNANDNKADMTLGDGPMLTKTRTLFSQGCTPGRIDTTDLESVRDLLKKQRELQDPRDMDRSFSQLHLDYMNGRLTAQTLSQHGLDPEVMLVHENAYSQMSSNVFPARFGSGLLQQAALGSTGEKLSTMSWSLWAQKNVTPRMMRTVKTRDVDGQIRRIIRSQHSQGYAVYDNFKFVQDLLDNAPELAEMPVLDFRVTDTGMRLRFSTDGTDKIELRKPIPIIEAWNSEVGRRRTVLNAGILKLICTNGMKSWDEKTAFAWRHFGDSSRISDGVASAVAEIQTSAAGVVDAYNSALDVAIDDAFAFMERELKREGLTQEQVGKAQKALDHEWTTPGGGLASIIDATTLIAQDYDMFVQSDIERAAARVLRRGQAEALRSGGRIRVNA